MTAEAAATAAQTTGTHVCPWWIGYLLASPIRRLFQRPEAIVGAHLRQGMTALDLGCAMGFFSIPMARLVGEGGRVICVDIQERMFRSLRRRAARAGVAERIEPHLCTAQGLGLEARTGTVGFALAFAVLHETPSQPRVLRELHELLAPGGKLLVAEPAGHVTEVAFERTLAAAREAGFSVVERPRIRRCHAALLAPAAP